MDYGDVVKLLAVFNDPDGVIDDAEDLLDQLPWFCEEIVRLTGQNGRLLKALQDEYIGSDWPEVRDAILNPPRDKAPRVSIVEDFAPDDMAVNLPRDKSPREDS